MRAGAAALLAVALTVTIVADSGARGYQVTGPLVAHGVSPAGVPWRIRAQREHIQGPDMITFAFSFKPPGYSDAGYFSSLPLPVPRDFAFHASQGSDLSPAEEGDISGVASQRVARLDLRLSDGTTVPVALLRAPKSARHEYPWLRRLRTFDRFFDGALQARRLTAFAASGDQLATARAPFFDGVVAP